MIQDDSFIIFFDGHCVLCHFWVRKILAYDRKRRFYFASLDSPLAKKFIEERQLGAEDSIIVWQKGSAYWLQSSAVYVISRVLGGPFYFLLLGQLFPRFFTDWVYRGVARVRKRWFGVYDHCPLPPKAFQDNFLA